MFQDNRTARQNQIRGSIRHLFAGALLIAIAVSPSCDRHSGSARPDRETVRREFLRLGGFLASENDPAMRAREVDGFRRLADSLGAPAADDSSATFLYFGPAERVRIAADFNRWDPEADTLTPVHGTTMFFRTIRLPRDSRIEYKFVVDSLWMTDPLNPHVVRGGFGENSELRMAAFVPDSLAVPKAGVTRGRIDTLAFTSRLLQRTHPVFVYSPPGGGSDPLPVLYVLDGGEYLSIAGMNHTLDNLIAARRVRPLLAVFFDPRTDPGTPASNRRMGDYTLNEIFVRSMVEDLVPFISGRYRVVGTPGETGLLGASLGGLTSTYAVWRNPEVFGVALVQSPAYWWDDEKIFDLMTKTPARGGRFWIETGTIHDAGEFAVRMRDLLLSHGREVAYAEVSQGHNWTHWQWTIPAGLEFFVGPPN